MINSILKYALKQRELILLGGFILLGLGLWSAFHLPIDAVPDITGVQVQINTEVPALAAEESEKLVTQPIEIELAGLPGVEEMRSLTKFGLSQVTLQFRDGTDIYRARQLVSERLGGIAEQLPPGATFRLAPISTGLGEIFYYNLQYRKDAPEKPSDPQAELINLHEVQDHFVRPLLRLIPGIAEINETGGYEYQYVIQPKTEILTRIGLTFTELADIIAQNVNNAGGGIISKGKEQVSIRVLSRVNTIQGIEELPIKFGAGVKPLLVKDVAEVSIGTKFRTGAATIDGKETVIGTTMMLAGENSRQVAQRVLAKIAEIQTILPPGIEIVPQYDRSELIDRTIGTVQKNLFEGAIFVLVVLLVLLGNWRASLIVATAIPLSFLFALIGMSQFGISGNLMSLGAIDFGLIVDGAVVVVENIVRRMREEREKLGRALNPRERFDLVLSASTQVGSPMFFGVLIITAVYIPIFALTGIEGKMFHPMALTVMLALGGSLLLALTLMPVLCYYFLGGQSREKDSAILMWTKGLYDIGLTFAFKFRAAVIFVCIFLIGLSIWIFPKLGAEFVPTLDEGSITAMLYKPVGMSIEESVRTDLKIEERLRQEYPEITRVFTRIGTSEVASDPMPPNETDVYIFYKPIHEWPKTEGRPSNKTELIEQLDATFKDLNPDYAALFGQPIEIRFNEMLEGTRAELAVKIYGDDYDVLEKLAEEIKGILETMPGISEIEYESEGRTPQLQIVAKPEMLQRYGIQAQEVNNAVTAALAGATVGTMLDGNKRHDIVVRLSENVRADLSQIEKLPLRVGTSGLVLLGNVVEIKEIRNVEPIRRDAGQRRAAIMVNLETRDIKGFVREAERRIREKVTFPRDYLLEFGGQFENLQRAQSRLSIVVPAALGIIFVLIFFALKSFWQTLLVYSGIPLALSGGVLALWVRDMPFSITAAVGFIALSGVAVLNGLVMISYFNELRAQGKSLEDAVTEGSLTRLRPILMTALVASFGFIPMALANGTGAEVQRPLATVVIGGIITSTLLTLIVVPVLYSWIGKITKGRPMHAENLAE